MSTASTKSRARDASPPTSRAPRDAEQTSVIASGNTRPSEVSERTWLIASILILAVAALARLYNVDLKPLHHDEGVNGFFLTNLVRNGVYHYDPSNYHGPTLYYFALLPAKLFGLTTHAIRYVPAFFGIATVWLVLLLRRHIGAIGALTAAALISVSPGAVYMSRYFIHEALFVFFTLGIVVAALRYYDEAKLIYLLLASASAALLFATKETAFISAGVLILAAGLAWGYISLRMRSRKPAPRAKSKGARGSKAAPGKIATVEEDLLTRVGGWSGIIVSLLIALALFIFINVLFYSSFFTYSEGVNGALETFKIWSKTGTKDHIKPFFEYFKWLWAEEAPILVLGIIGAALAVWRAENRFTIFAGAWAFGLLMAYSLVPYKTPWLMLNFIIPLAIIGGYSVDVFYRVSDGAQARALSLALASAAIAICSYQMIALNFYHYDNDKYPYVYAHTKRELKSLVDEIDQIAKRAGTGEQTTIAVVSPDYWPLPWYLRDYKHVGFHGRIITAPTDAIIIGSEAQQYELQSVLGDRYQRINSSYDLRPGVSLALYMRR